MKRRVTDGKGFVDDQYVGFYADGYRKCQAYEHSTRICLGWLIDEIPDIGKIGYLILSAQFNMDTALVFAALLSITIFTTLGVGIVVLFEYLFLNWRPSQRAT